MKPILLFLIVQGSFSTFAQSVFVKLDSTDFLSSSIIQNNDDFFVTSDFWNNGIRSVSFSNFNNIGDKISKDTLTQYPILSGTGRSKLLNNSIYNISTINEIPPYEPINKDILLTKINVTNQFEYSFSVGGNSQEITGDLTFLNSNIYLSGSTKSFGDINGDFYVVKTDTSGNVIWERTYGENDKREELRSIEKTKDGNLLLTGQKLISGINWNIYLVKIDTLGNVIWERNYGENLNDFGGRSIIQHDHSLILLRGYNDGFGGATVSYVEKIDGNGELVWSVPIPYDDFSSLATPKPIENEDGSITVMNAIKNSEGTIINRMLKLDPLGTILWTKEYYTRTDIHQYIYDIAPTSDGGYIMCGSAFPVGINTQHAWLVKTNCNGEEGVQHPITATPCEQYDCTLYPIDASFSATATTIDLADGGVIQFENNSANATSRVWNFGDGEMEYTDSLLSHTFTQTGTYEVQLVVFHGMCSDTMTQTIEVINTTGIEDLVLETGMSIFPNPSKESFTVRFKNPFEGKMNIIDLLGRNYSTTNISKETQSYTFSNLPKGIYLVEVEMNNGRKEVKRIEVI